MLQLSADPILSREILLLQRMSVIVTELLFAYASFKYCSRFVGSHAVDRFAVVFLSPGLLIVDCIHFQYNGFMYGLLVLALYALRQEQVLVGAFIYAVLINFKHIYLYLAPAFFVYLLRRYCWKGGLYSFDLKQFASLGLVVVGVFGVSLYPFRAQLPQLLSRLFPFKRGLNHTYWAANFWAVYSFVDVVLAHCMRSFFKFPIDGSKLTKGILGAVQFAILPNITAPITLVLTILSHIPAIYRIWKQPTFKSLLEGVIVCAYGSFLFGWHVHEKAILMVIIPFSFYAIEHRYSGPAFFILQLAGHYALFPLLFGVNETPVKVLSLILYSYLLIYAMDLKLTRAQRLYSWGFVVVQML
eukprot:Partr_v1_DN28284_c1_g4_i7_m75283 putative Asparagine-linked glycosylation 8, alpha-1,3-glucosyltransferase homolog (S. cerevisiae)